MKYFLFARNRVNNELVDINVGNGHGCELEEIDAFTNSFDNADDMTNYLIRCNKITEKDMDYFIVSQKNVKGESQLYTQEVIYSNESIKKILNNPADESTYKTILQTFASRMGKDCLFFDLVSSHYKSNIYPKFIDYFSSWDEGVDYSVLYRDGAWAIQNYKLVRNVIEFTDRYHASLKGNDYSYEDNQVSRELVKDDLLKLTSKDYDSSQYDFFDLIEPKPDYEKILKVGRYLQKIDSSVFNENGEISENYILGMDDMDSLLSQTLIPTDFMKKIYAFIQSRDIFNKSVVYSNEKYYHEDKMKNIQREIYKELSFNNKLLESVSKWISVYDKHHSSNLGDCDGYQKVKKN